MSAPGPFQPRRLSAFVSAIGGLAAAPAVLSARQLMIHLVSSPRCPVLLASAQTGLDQLAAQALLRVHASSIMGAPPRAPA